MENRHGKKETALLLYCRVVSAPVLLIKIIKNTVTNLFFILTYLCLPSGRLEFKLYCLYFIAVPGWTVAAQGKSLMNSQLILCLYQCRGLVMKLAWFLIYVITAYSGTWNWAVVAWISAGANPTQQIKNLSSLLCTCSVIWGTLAHTCLSGPDRQLRLAASTHTVLLCMSVSGCVTLYTDYYINDISIFCMNLCASVCTYESVRLHKYTIFFICACVPTWATTQFNWLLWLCFVKTLCKLSRKEIRHYNTDGTPDQIHSCASCCVTVWVLKMTLYLV